MLIDDFKRLIRPIKNRIFLMLGRAVLKLVENTEETQRIGVLALADETISRIERFQEYGFETYPITEAQVFIGFLNGNRDHGIVLCVHDERYRPTDLSEGETMMYTYDDATTPFRIQMKRDRIHYRRSDIEDIDIDTSKTEDIGTSKTETIGTDKIEKINGNKTETIGVSKTEDITTSKTVTTPSETHSNSSEFIVNSPEVSLGGAAFAGLRKLIDERMITLFNNHVHSGVDVGGGNSGPPTVASSAANQATSKVKAI